MCLRLGLTDGTGATVGTTLLGSCAPLTVASTKTGPSIAARARGSCRRSGLNVGRRRRRIRGARRLDWALGTTCFAWFRVWHLTHPEHATERRQTVSVMCAVGRLFALVRATTGAAAFIGGRAWTVHSDARPRAATEGARARLLGDNLRGQVRGGEAAIACATARHSIGLARVRRLDGDADPGGTQPGAAVERGGADMRVYEAPALAREARPKTAVSVEETRLAEAAEVTATVGATS